MTKMTFNDGVSFETSGPVRVEECRDGLYVVGGGMLVPVGSRAEAEATIAELAPVRSPEEATHHCDDDQPCLERTCTCDCNHCWHLRNQL